MLGVVNLLLVITIVVVIIVNMILISRRFNAIEQTLASRNLLDLAEFNKLDGEFKRNYQTYVVNGVMPHVMDEANKTIKAYKINETIKANKDAINDAIDTMPYMMYASAKKSNSTDTSSSTTSKGTKAEPVSTEKFMSYSAW